MFLRSTLLDFVCMMFCLYRYGFTCYSKVGVSFLSISRKYSKELSHSGINYPHAFLKKRRDIVIASVRLCVRYAVCASVMLSPPKPLDEIQPDLVCELLT